MKREILEVRPQRTPLERVIPLSTPYTVFIDPCGACNFTCNFCPCNMSNYRDQDRHKIMSFELFKKIVDDMKEFDRKIKVVNLFSFGEPLLNKQFPDMVRYLKNQDVCDEIRTISNGSLLNPKLNQVLVESGLDFIRISVEALSTEGYKLISGVNIDFDEFIENIRDLYHRSRGKLQIQAKIVNSSLKSEENVQRFFDIFTPIADYVNIEDIKYDWSEFAEINYPDDSIRVHDTHCGGEVCARPLIHMVIHSNGEVGACCTDWKFKTVYGDVKTQSLKQIWNSEKLRQFQIMHLAKKRNELDFCRTCTLKSDDNIDDVSEIILDKLMGRK